jgi:hypothetical protein
MTRGPIWGNRNRTKQSINQEINEPSYEMVGVKITVTNYGQNNRIFGISLQLIIFKVKHT